MEAGDSAGRRPARSHAHRNRVGVPAHRLQVDLRHPSGVRPAVDRNAGSPARPTTPGPAALSVVSHPIQGGSMKRQTLSLPLLTFAFLSLFPLIVIAQIGRASCRGKSVDLGGRWVT